ncbi:type II toxin-antitoxin system RelE/ParE family toxin [Mesorhizobium sp. M0029]|uniref:type II toxin-antitoxin system RelE/ParE family toxin n=1 Tax=Mesorhizobium sp. M0029 TaxID=2956850 RepID=UPI003335641A
MEHRIVFHPKAETELDQLYDDIATRASPAIAWNFVVGIRDDFLSVSTFPQCGTERVEIMPGPRIIGWRRAVSIAFAVDAERVWSWVSFSPAATSRRNCWKAGSEALLRLAWGSTLARRRFSGRWYASAVEGWGLVGRVNRGGTPLTISAKPAHEFPPRGYLHEKSKKHRR